MSFLEDVNKAIGKASHGISDAAKNINSAAQDAIHNIEKNDGNEVNKIKGRNNKESSNICPHCGAPLKINKRTKFCEFCGAQLDFDDGVKRSEHIDYAKVRKEERIERVQIKKLEKEERENKRRERNSFIMLGVCVILVIACFIFLSFSTSKSSKDSSPSGSEYTNTAEKTFTEATSDIGSVETSSGGNNAMEVEMPHSAKFYVEEGWSLEEVKSELEKLGFNNITVKDKEIDTTDDDVYDKEVREVGDDTTFAHYSWDTGEKINTDHEIVIWHNIYITPENNKSFATALASNQNIWEEFAKNNADKFVVFDAVVDYAGDYDGVTLWHADVKQEGCQGPEIHLSPTLTTKNVDKSIKEGDKVTVMGWVDNSQTEYYGTLAIKAIDIQKK